MAAELLAKAEEDDAPPPSAEELRPTGGVGVWTECQPGSQWSRHRFSQARCFIKGAELPLFFEVHQCIVLPSLVAVLMPTAEPVLASRRRESEPKKGKGAKETQKPGAKKGRPSTVEEPVKPAEKWVEQLPPDPAQDPQSFLVWHERHAATSVDFGSLPALKAVERTIAVRNVGNKPAAPSVKALDPFGPFTVLKPPTPVRPGQLCEVVIGFKATAAAVYTETLTLTATGFNQVIIPMRGTGLTPEMWASLGPCPLKHDKMPVTVRMPDGTTQQLEVEAGEPVESVLARLPQGGGGVDTLTLGGMSATSGDLLQHIGVQREAVLDASWSDAAANSGHTQTVAVTMGSMIALGDLRQHPGHVVAGELRKRTLTLENKSPFDVPFNVSFNPCAIEPFNHGGSIPFAVTPARGVIPALDKRDVVCTFLADHAFEDCRGEAVCEYGGSGRSIRLRFYGSAWGQGVYCRTPGAFRFSDAVSLRGGAVVPLGVRNDDMSSLFADLKLPGTGQALGLQQRLLIEFSPAFAADGTLLRAVNHAVCIGNPGKGDGKGAAPGEAQVELLDPRDLRAPPKQQLLGFEVNAPGGKLVLPAGEEKLLNVTFAPTDAAALRERELPVEGVGITVEAVLRVTLKGGFPAPPPERSVTHITLKGNLRIPAAF